MGPLAHHMPIPFNKPALLLGLLGTARRSRGARSAQSTHLSPWGAVSTSKARKEAVFLLREFAAGFGIPHAKNNWDAFSSAARGVEKFAGLDELGTAAKQFCVGPGHCHREGAENGGAPDLLLSHCAAECSRCLPAKEMSNCGFDLAACGRPTILVPIIDGRGGRPTSRHPHPKLTATGDSSWLNTPVRVVDV